MAIYSFYFLGVTGEVIIEKHWRKACSREAIKYFWQQVNAVVDKAEVPPVLVFDHFEATIYIFSILVDGNFFVATTGKANFDQKSWKWPSIVLSIHTLCVHSLTLFLPSSYPSSPLHRIMADAQRSTRHH
jgi:hypothetical protein